MFGFLGKLLIKVIGGTRNERIIRKRMEFITDEVNPLEPEMRALSDEQLLTRSNSLRERFADGAARESLKAEVFALVREVSRRARNHRQFDVQLVAGMVLDEGWVAEEATGEGKTIACYPAIYMAVLEGLKVHVVTTVDYLVQRDAEFAQPVFAMLGITVGYITSDMPAYGPDAEVRRQAYKCDITYGTNSEFGFDYLRDNMKMSLEDQAQVQLGFAIVDEVDNILIDEARTPLIISGPAYGDTDRYSKVDLVARELLRRNRDWDRTNRRVESLKSELKSFEGERSKNKDNKDSIDKKIIRIEADFAQAEDELAQQIKYYEVEVDRKSVHMTHEGVAAAQDIAGVGSFFVGANMEWSHLMEQSLRAHVVYERDKEYVVQNGHVVIVDEFTGRLLEGRQWSDGLHQAVEAKEGVAIKEETQTMATITLQNYFKLYKKLAGMTGTAMTEAGEFFKIYNLDVAAVPTHRPINRMDYNDRIYADTEAKFRALVEEINEVSKAGRPVLVGTTSIEKSEKLSTMLTRTYGIAHEVLNARSENAAREADIVANAGFQSSLKQGSKQMVGNVTIATNMAGRGTDIKLGPGVVYEKCQVPSDEKMRELGFEPEWMFPAGTNKCCIKCEQYDSATNCSHCFKTKISDEFPLRGRTECRANVPCGLHIVGTERHEARRIDNQLRGRAGRQGDPGSGRFFLSLRDELIAIFAGEWMLKVFGWLGIQGDVPIEHKRISKGIMRAQKKVEQRNFEMRKNLLEYDEIMDHQRHTFYSQRQQVLEGIGLGSMVMDMIRESIAEAVDGYLSGRYSQRCIAEWARQNLQIQIEDDQIRARNAEDLPSLEDNLRNKAKDEAQATITITLGEYMGEDLDQGEWDLRGLSGWAMSRFNVNLSQNQLRKMSPQEVEAELVEAASEKIDEVSLTPLARLLDENFAVESLAEWAHSKFGIDIQSAAFGETAEEASVALIEKVEAAYQRREIEYPVEYAMDVTLGQSGADNVYAAQSLAEWANRKYAAELTGDDLRDAKPEDIHARLTDLSEQWITGDKLEESIRKCLGSNGDVDAAIEFARERFDTELTGEDFDGDVSGKLMDVGRQFLRREMTELERYVLLQILDSSWKDHLLAMDHLKSGIGLRGYAEQDPKVAYKREGSAMFGEMLASIQDKVTDMIFKVRLGAGQKVESVYQISDMVHEQLSAYDGITREMDDRQAQAGETQKVQTITRNVPRVGRNDPCPCGSGKKFKKCCGKEA